MNIDDLDKLKFTSIKRYIIHFKYDNEFYFIHINDDGTISTSLYKGRHKSSKNERITGTFGYIDGLIKYKNNKKVLSAIDKRNFVKKLYKAKFIETNIMEIKEEVEKEKIQCRELVYQIQELENKLSELQKA